MAVSKRLRYEILKRDNHTCRYCGGTAPDAVLTIDHVVPVSLGGTDLPENLVAACRDCNAGKSSVPANAPLVDDVAQDALRWASAMEAAAIGAAAIRLVNQWAYDRIEDAWNGGWHNQWGPTIDPAWKSSVAKFLEAGLTADDIVEAIEKAFSNKTIEKSSMWKYTCGILWSTLRHRQDVARQILAAEDAEAGGQT